MAFGRADLLAWMNPNTIVLQEPGDILLREGKYLGYRPVHHNNVGSRYDGPLDPFWEEVYGRCRVFIHQAVLSGVILSTLAPDEIQELSQKYNYPLHLHKEDVTGHRPTYLEELATIRNEGFYEDPHWMGKMPAEEPLKRWIAERLPRSRTWESS